MPVRPYIGITGFTRPSQVEMMLAGLVDTRYQLMVGVLASAKTIAGHVNRWPGRYPSASGIGKVFLADPRCLNLVHFNTSGQSDLDQELLRVLSLAGPHCHGLQLNIAWPNVRILQKLQRRDNPIRIVLQIGARAFHDAGNSPHEVARRIADYGASISDILLDRSGGYGTLMNPLDLHPFLEEIRSANQGIGIGVAGGLCFQSIHLVAPLARWFPGISIDAEGQLRTVDDDLDIDAAREYLVAARELLEVE